MSPGQREAGQRGERDVGGPAEPGLEHPAAPHRHAVRGADVVDAPRLEVAADAAGLDVDDRAGAERDGVGRGPRRGDRLVEADRRPQVGGRARRGRGTSSSGSGCSISSRSNASSSRQVPGVGQRVGGVGVDLQEHVVAEPLAHGPHRLDVPARLDLELDPEVALGEVAGDGVEQLRDASDGCRPSTPAGTRSCDRPEVGAQATGRPARSSASSTAISRARLGHRVPFDTGEQRPDPCRGDPAVALSGGEPGQQMVAQDVLGAVDVLRGVERARHRRRTRPSPRRARCRRGRAARRVSSTSRTRSGTAPRAAAAACAARPSRSPSRVQPSGVRAPLAVRTRSPRCGTRAARRP